MNYVMENWDIFSVLLVALAFVIFAVLGWRKAFKLDKLHSAIIPELKNLKIAGEISASTMVSLIEVYGYNQMKDSIETWMRTLKDSIPTPDHLDQKKIVCQRMLSLAEVLPTLRQSDRAELTRLIANVLRALGEDWFENGDILKKLPSWPTVNTWPEGLSPDKVF